MRSLQKLSGSTSDQTNPPVFPGAFVRYAGDSDGTHGFVLDTVIAADDGHRFLGAFDSPWHLLVDWLEGFEGNQPGGNQRPGLGLFGFADCLGGRHSHARAIFLFSTIGRIMKFLWIAGNPLSKLQSQEVGNPWLLSDRRGFNGNDFS
jgi:hypothetical protein